MTTKYMITIEQFPYKNRIWEELDVRQHTWTTWKTTYRVAAKKEKIKREADREKYQFGATYNAIQQPAPTQPGRASVKYLQPMKLEALDGYFENITSTETNDKLVLDDLVANLANLTANNAYMEYKIEELYVNNVQLQQQLNILQKKLSCDESCGALWRQLVVGRNK